MEQCKRFGFGLVVILVLSVMLSYSFKMFGIDFDILSAYAVIMLIAIFNVVGESTRLENISIILLIWVPSTILYFVVHFFQETPTFTFIQSLGVVLGLILLKSFQVVLKDCK